MVCAKINIHYVGRQETEVLKILCTDVSDMQKNISELSQKPGIDYINLNDYASIPFEDWLQSKKRIGLFESTDSFVKRLERLNSVR